MNHIHRLTQERDDARATLASAQDELTRLMAYLDSPKFAWPEGDYVHIRTDLMPKLVSLRSAMAEGGWTS
jgi:hypothetical protein